MTQVMEERALTARIDRRQRVQRLLELARHLEESDRLLVEQVYRHGRPLSELARACRISPRNLQVRLSKAIRRMGQPDFLFLAYRSHLLDPPTRSAAKRVVGRGLTYREAAGQLGVSLHDLRGRMLAFRRSLHAALLARPTSPAAADPPFNNH